MEVNYFKIKLDILWYNNSMSLLKNLSDGKYRIIQIQGPTGSGKTSFILNLLNYIKENRTEGIKELDQLFKVSHNYIYLAPNILIDQYRQYLNDPSNVFMSCSVLNGDFLNKLSKEITEKNISILVIDEIRFEENGIASQARGLKFLIDSFRMLSKENRKLKTLYIVKDQVRSFKTFPQNGTTIINHASDLTIKIDKKGISLENDVLSSVLDINFKENKIIKTS